MNERERERGGENVKKEEEREKEDKSLWRERLRLFVSSLAPPIKNKKNKIKHCFGLFFILNFIFIIIIILCAYLDQFGLLFIT